jgi:hypothetical protein
MEIETRKIHIFWLYGDIQAVQAAQDAGMHLGVDLPSSAALPKLGQTFAFEAPDHISM